jgi:hypothetical protein
MDVSVTVEADRKPKVPSYSVKLQSEVFEVNIRIPADEVEELKLVASTTWEDGSMQIGEASGAPVFWSTEDGVVALLIGEDDENWDIALSVPVAVMDEIIQAIAKA